MDVNHPGRRLSSNRDLTAVFQRSRTIAIVGASYLTAEPAYFVPEYLKTLGYRILPVSPLGGEILGEPVYRSLAEIPGPVDIVCVFRLLMLAEAGVLDAVALGAEVLWYQPGTDSEPATRLAIGAGLSVVTGRCIGGTHADLGLGPAARAQVGRPKRHCDKHRPQRARTAGAHG